MIKVLLQNENIRFSCFGSKKLNFTETVKTYYPKEKRNPFFDYGNEEMYKRKSFDTFSSPKCLLNQVFLCTCSKDCKKRLKLYLFSDRAVIVEISTVEHALPLEKRKKLSPHFKVGKYGEFLSVSIIPKDEIESSNHGDESEEESEDDEENEKKRKIDEIQEYFKKETKNLEEEFSKKIKKLKKDFEKKIEEFE